MKISNMIPLDALPEDSWIPLIIEGDLKNYRIPSSLLSGGGGGCCSLDDTTSVGYISTRHIEISGHGFAFDVGYSGVKLVNTVAGSFWNAIHLDNGDLNFANSLLPISSLILSHTGQLILGQYGIGTFADTPDYYLGVKSDGSIVEIASADVGGGASTPNLQQVTDIGSVTTNGATFGKSVSINETTIFSARVEGDLGLEDSSHYLFLEIDNPEYITYPYRFFIPVNTLDRYKLLLVARGDSLEDRFACEVDFVVTCDSDGHATGIGSTLVSDQTIYFDDPRVKIIEQTGKFLPLSGSLHNQFISAQNSDGSEPLNSFSVYIVMNNEPPELFNAKVVATIIRTRIHNVTPIATPDVAFRVDDTNNNNYNQRILNIISNATYGIDIQKSEDGGTNWTNVLGFDGQSDPDFQDVLLAGTDFSWDVSGPYNLYFRVRARSGGGFDPSEWVTFNVVQGRDLGYTTTDIGDGNFEIQTENVTASRLQHFSSNVFSKQNDTSGVWSDASSFLTGSITSNPSAGNIDSLSYSVPDSSSNVRLELTSSFSVTGIGTSRELTFYDILSAYSEVINLIADVTSSTDVSLYFGVGAIAGESKKTFINWGDGSPVEEVDTDMTTPTHFTHTYASAGEYTLGIIVRQVWKSWSLSMTSTNPIFSLDSIYAFCAYIVIANQKLSSDNVDQIIDNCFNSDLVSGVLNTLFQTPSAPPSLTSEVSILESRGWTVSTD